MPRGGQNAKPIEVHILEGSYRKTRHKERGAIGGGEPLPKPEGMGEEASTLWDKITEARADWLCSSDAESLQSLCEAWELSRSALAKLKKDVTNRDARVAFKDYMAIFNGLAQRFGLTPADRARLGIAAKPVEGVRRRNHYAIEEMLS